MGTTMIFLRLHVLLGILLAASGCLSFGKYRYPSFNSLPAELGHGVHQRISSTHNPGSVYVASTNRMWREVRIWQGMRLCWIHVPKTDLTIVRWRGRVLMLPRISAFEEGDDMTGDWMPTWEASGGNISCPADIKRVDSVDGDELVQFLHGCDGVLIDDGGDGWLLRKGHREPMRRLLLDRRHSIHEGPAYDSFAKFMRAWDDGALE